MSLASSHTPSTEAQRTRWRAGDRRLGPLEGLGGLIRTWRERSRTRRSLAQCSERILRDMGISPSQAAFEARQPFWRPISRLREY